MHRIVKKEVFMLKITPRLNFMRLFYDNRPQACSELKGSSDYPDISGFVNFFVVPVGGVLLEAEVFGLPDSGGLDAPAFYAFHMHEYGDCSDQFAKTGAHYNPGNKLHAMHAGDLPPLISYNGYAWLSFYNQKLELYDVIGKSMVIHRNPDDFITQPSGNSGEKIACGVVESNL